MNEEIELSDHNLQENDLGSQDDMPIQFEKLGPGVPTQALDPRSYAFVPSNWTQRIRAAGQNTKKSEYVGSLLHHPESHQKSEPPFAVNDDAVSAVQHQQDQLSCEAH